jgi:hypothetical protein
MGENFDASDRARAEDFTDQQPTVLGSKDRVGQATVDNLYEVIGTRNAIQPANEFEEETASADTLVPLPDPFLGES